MKKLTQMTPAERQARIAKLVKNPGTRSKVPTKYLPAQYRQQRELNTRLAQPIVPGSGVTRRDLAHEREAAVTTQFGANAEAKREQQGRDVGGWYDQYVNELKAHRANVDAAGQQAQANLSGIGEAVRGLDQSQLASQLKASVEDAATRGAEVSTDVAKTASDASMARQNLFGAFRGVQNAQGANATNFADTLAHVVGPGQRLQARAQEQGKLDELRGAMGAFRTKFEGERKADEAKTVLAKQSLGLDTAKAQADIDLARGVDPVTKQRLPGKPKTASEKKTEAELAYFNKHGYWPPTGPPKRGKDAGRDWQSPEAQGKARATLAKTSELARKLREGQGIKNPKFIDAAKTPDQQPWIVKPGTLTRQQAGRLLKSDSKAPDQALITAALDIAYLGRLSPGTVKLLHAGGYKVGPMGYSTKRPASKPKPKSPPKKTSGPVLQIPALGGPNYGK